MKRLAFALVLAASSVWAHWPSDWSLHAPKNGLKAETSVEQPTDLFLPERMIFRLRADEKIAPCGMNFRKFHPITLPYHPMQNPGRK